VAVRFSFDAQGEADQKGDDKSDAEVEVAGERQVSAPAAVAARFVLAPRLVRQLR